jgi:membrane dipeptidase
MTPELEHARTLIDEHIVVDSHSDYAVQLYREHCNGMTTAMRDLHIPSLQAGGVNLEVLTVGGDFTLGQLDLRETLTTLRIIEAARREIIEQDHVLITASAQLEDITPDSLAFMFALEGVRPVDDDLAMLRIFHALGLRSVILTHNERNLAAEGCAEPGGGGLSSFGRSLVREVDRLGMILDLVHINERSFFDALEEYSRPVIVSHSNARAVHDHVRNLSDEQIRAVAERDGVIGLNFLGMFITARPSEATVDMLADHAAHIASVAGVRSLCLGPDYADYLMDAMQEWLTRDDLPADTLAFARGAETVNELEVVVEGFLRRGFSDDDMRGILGENALRVYRHALR